MPMIGILLVQMSLPSAYRQLLAIMWLQTSWGSSCLRMSQLLVSQQFLYFFYILTIFSSHCRLKGCFQSTMDFYTIRATCTIGWCHFKCGTATLQSLQLHDKCKWGSLHSEYICPCLWGWITKFSSSNWPSQWDFASHFFVTCRPGCSRCVTWRIHNAWLNDALLSTSPSM